MARQPRGKETPAAAKKTSPERGSAKRVAPRGRKTPANNVDSDQRRLMIAEAAYYIAEQRGFNGGDCVRDWLLAEQEIDRRLDIS